MLADGAKLAGILAEQAGDAIVVGIGINVGARASELPPPRPGALPPTSLALLGAPRSTATALLAAVLRELEHWYQRWTAPGPGDADAPAACARSTCAAAPRSAARSGWSCPAARVLTGRASGIGPAGRLVETRRRRRMPVTAGDVIHVR